MAHFKTGHSSVQDEQPKAPKLPLIKPKPDERWRGSESPESSRPTPPRTPVMKTPLQQTFSNNVCSASVKPAWKTSGVGSITTAPKPPDVPKPKISSVSSLKSQFSQSQEHHALSMPRPFQSTNINPPQSLAKQNTFPKQESAGIVKDGLQTSNTISSVFPKPSLMLKPISIGQFQTQQHPQKEGSDPSVPRKKILPNLYTLGNPSLKPKRPPNVDLQRFRGSGSSLNDDPGINIPLSLATSPTAQTDFNYTNDMSQQLDQEESYDDVGVMSPQPVPPLEGHHARKMETETDEEEMYEDLDERWIEKEEKAKKSQDKEAGKEKTKHSKDTAEKQACKKGEKKKQQEEKRFQKAKEKREKEAKKKFKLKGPVHVIQQGAARQDCRGGKTELPLREGEVIDIIRITDNPKGLWLARNIDGYYGYVKPDSVNIDYDRLKQAKTGPVSNWSEAEPEVYDDVGAPADACSELKDQKVGDGDIYDEVESPDQDDRFPPPPPPITYGDEIYDDVDSQDFPPPPPPDSLSQLIPQGQQDVLDPKKQKMFAKEEMKFRKKFKFEGEIQVLHDVTVAATLTTKKWGSKDLHLRPGEVINVIVKPADGKLIGRNAEGKYGYVDMANIAQDTSDIYDDIGEDCIYDND
ncbi:FYN-binding protein 1-like [Myripristis murdjan]|uniref:FYN-binding protein 1-like n=1 Tax=Myripristis murdjan TaxID=586833 RepID=UPI001175ECC5|nr:FYN-binding protein 1-like [Myripristis murdjan]